METYLCFPDGASGAWFHGRVLASAASSSSSSSSASASASAARRVTHSLFAAQVVHQHECLAPADGSRLEYDVCLLEHGGESGVCAQLTGIVAEEIPGNL